MANLFRRRGQMLHSCYIRPNVHLCACVRPLHLVQPQYYLRGRGNDVSCAHVQQWLCTHPFHHDAGLCGLKAVVHPIFLCYVGRARPRSRLKNNTTLSFRLTSVSSDDNEIPVPAIEVLGSGICEVVIVIVIESCASRTRHGGVECCPQQEA